MCNNEFYSKLRESTAKDIIDNYKVKYFITLTFKYKTEKEVAEQNLLKFLNALNRKVFGSRSKKSLIIVPSLERHKFEGYHIHLLMEDPQQRTQANRDLSEHSLKELVRSTWQSTSSITANLKESCPGDKEWFKTIKSIEGVAHYVTKDINSFNPDTIAWDLANKKGYRPNR